MADLQEVTDRFSIFKDGRTLGANGRKYMLESVQRMFASKQFLEGLRLGEHYGYFGHQARVRKGLRVPESEVVVVNGKAINLTNIPSNITAACSIDDAGVVTHTQRILRSETGGAVTSLLESTAGGWSWAVGGVEQGAASIARKFYGFDYVTTPNYISLDRQGLMLESNDSEQMMLESLSGVAGDAAGDLLSYWRNNQVEFAVMASEVEMLQAEIAMMESAHVMSIVTKSELKSVTEERDALKREHEALIISREEMMLEAIDSLPVFLSEEQRNVLKKADDKDKLVSLLESIGNAGKNGSLPLGGGEKHMVSMPHNKPVAAGVTLGKPLNPFKKRS